MKDFTIKPWIKIVAWISASIIVYLNIQLVIEQINQWINQAATGRFWIYVVVIPIAIASAALLFYVFIHPFVSRAQRERMQLPHGYAEQLMERASIRYKHIGIAIDFSGKDQKIIQNAMTIGGNTATYTFIHVVESALSKVLGKDTDDLESRSDQEHIDFYANRLLQMGYEAKGILGFNQRAKEIVRIIKENDADILVIGAHGIPVLKIGFTDKLLIQSGTN